MKKFLLSLAVLMGAMTAAADVTVDFSTEENKALLPADYSEEAATATIDGVKFTFVNCKGNGYQGENYLMIGGKNREAGSAYFEFTLPAETSSFVITTGSGASTNVDVQLSAEGNNIGDAVKLNAKGADFTFNVPAANQAAGSVLRLAVVNNYNGQVTKIVFKSEGGSVEPGPGPEPTAGSLEQSFTDGSLGDFVVENKMESEFEGWYTKTNYPECVIANSYVNGANVAAESWLISPEVELGSNATLSFEQGLGFTFDAATLNKFISVCVQADGGEWDTLAIPYFPAKGNGNWSAFEPVSFDLAAYNGKTVKVALRYTNDGAQSIAWEIKNFSLKSTSGIADITVDENAPVEYYNLQGVRVANPAAGQLVIRRQGSSVSKVIVK